MYSLITHPAGPLPGGMCYEGVDCFIYHRTAAITHHSPVTPHSPRGRLIWQSVLSDTFVTSNVPGGLQSKNPWEYTKFGACGNPWLALHGTQP